MSRSRGWTINGDFVALKPTGVARYARNVTHALDALLGENGPLVQNIDLRLVVPCKPQGLDLQHIRIKVVPEFRSPRIPQAWVQLQLPRSCSGGLVSFCNLAPVSQRKQIVCIHDLQTALVPDSYNRMFILAHKIILPWLGHQVGFVATVSQFSRDCLVSHGIAPAEKIFVTHNGAEHALSWQASRSELELGPRPMVLCLGRPEAHKNTGLIWKLAGELDEMGLDAYVAGNIGDPLSYSNGGPTPKNVRLLGRVNDDDLAKLYRHAVCLLFPSRIEGFGLPSIEAMALKCPVVASTAPCMPETCGDAALYADPDDQEGWITAIERLFHDDRLRADVIARGVERARLYSWRRIAQKYIEHMARMDNADELCPSLVTS